MFAATGAAVTMPNEEDPWQRAMRLAHELSQTFDRLSRNGTLAAKIYAEKSGHARVNFVQAEPCDAEGFLQHHARALAQAVRGLDPTATEYFVTRGVDDDRTHRFAVIVHSPLRSEVARFTNRLIEHAIGAGK